MASTLKTAEQLQREWRDNPRWKGVERGYKAEDVVKLRGSVAIEHTLARRGAEKLWRLLNTEEFVNALGALTGNQAMQQVKAGLKAIYCSGWQVAADSNTAGQMYPDQSLYPADAVPALVRRINNSFQRLDQILTSEGQEHEEQQAVGRPRWPGGDERRDGGSEQHGREGHERGDAGGGPRHHEVNR